MEGVWRWNTAGTLLYKFDFVVVRIFGIMVFILVIVVIKFF